MFQAEQQRRQESETLRESVAIVASTLDRKQAIDLILDQLARVVQFDSASVQILHDGYLEIVGGRGWSSESAVLGLKFAVPGNNPNTRIIQEKRSVVISGNIDESYKPFQSELHNHIQSWLGVPLITHGTVIGMLSLDSAQPDHFSEEHIRLATAFANHAAIAIDNARVHEQSELQIRRLTILRDVDTAIASSLDLRVTLGLLIDHARSQLKMDAIEILVYNPKLQLLESTAQRGLEGSSLPRGLRIGESLAGHIALNRKPLQISDLNTSNEYSHLKPGGMEKFTSYIGLPLIGKGQIKGVMQVFFIHAYTPDANWREFIQMLAGQAAIAIDSTQLFENLQVSNQEITLAYDTTLEGWGKAMELRDRETQGHTQRVTTLTVKLARRMGVREADLAHIRRGVLLHDIGKMGIPDRILHKNGPLDETEWQLMRQHPQFAFDLLNPIAFLRPALEIPFCHHEKWDGTGYPRGLKGVDIPLTARIFAVVDVWDALSSDRAYRPAWGKNEVIAYLQSESNKHFDPSVVNAFLRILDDESGYENIK